MPRNPCIIGVWQRQARGQNHNWVAHPALSGAQKMAEWLCNPDILGGPQRQARGQNQMWLPHPYLLQGPKEGGIAATLVFSRVADAKRGDQIRIGCLTPTFCRPKRWHNCYVTRAFLGSPTPSAGTKSDVASSPVPSQGPKRWRNCYVTPAISGVQRQARGPNQMWLTHPCLLGGQKWAELLRNPCILGGSPTPRGDKIRIGCLTLAFSGAQKMAELPRNPCILGGPQCSA